MTYVVAADTEHMSRIGLPEIEITGGQSFQHHMSGLCRKVEFGAVVRIVHLATGRHRAWFTRERPGGCEPIRITVYELQHGIGKALDAVRDDGAVYQVYDARSGWVRGYIYWAAPEWLARLEDKPFIYFYRSRSGRVIRRSLYPLAVDAQPRPPRDRDAEAARRVQARGVLHAV